jgi:hypothetical protein
MPTIFPGDYPVGRYTVRNDKVLVTLTLARDQAAFSTLPVDGTTGNLPELAAKFVEAISEAANLIE